MFVEMLTYKAERKGKQLVKIDRWFPSSKTCCQCGHVHKELTLSDRTYICPVCGHVMDRDKQAAINILKEAIRTVIRQETAEFTHTHPTLQQSMIRVFVIAFS